MSDDIDEILDGLTEIAKTVPKESRRKPSHPIAKAVSALVMALSGLVSFLIVAAYVGIYIEPLRPLWTSWPSDAAKFTVTFLMFLFSAILLMWYK